MSQATVRSLLAASLISLAASAAHAADAAAPVASAASAGAPAAHWVQRKLDFTYMGFTTKYTCDGLRDDVRELLVALGARKKDLQIHSTGCTKLIGPEPFPGVSATFWVLVPVTPEDVGKVGEGAAEATQWQNVNLLTVTQVANDQGQCELLEQLKNDALRLFTTRNLHFRATCVPHQITPGDIEFTVETLRPAPPAAPAKAPAAPSA